MFCTLETEGEVSVRETDKLLGAWLGRKELAGRAGEMETWSSLVIPELQY